ncbi:MAG: CBS domain-containing protein [bacterium]
MFVRDCMTANPRTIEPGVTLEEAFGLMRALRIRHLPVVDGPTLVGIITWTDLMGTFASSWTAARSRTSVAVRNARVAGVMTRDPFTIAPDAPVEMAARLLRERKIGSLPVVDRRKLVGIVTESDLFDTLVHLLGGDIRGVRMSVVLPNGLHDLAKFIHALGDLTAEKEAITVVARLDGASAPGMCEWRPRPRWFWRIAWQTPVSRSQISGLNPPNGPAEHILPVGGERTCP